MALLEWREGHLFLCDCRRGLAEKLGWGNQCGMNGKRFFRKMEAWNFEKCEMGAKELEQQL